MKKIIDSNKDLKQDSATVKRIKDFLKLTEVDLTSETLEEIVREISCVKLCDVIGLKRKCNLKNDFFSFFSLIMGEAISEHLDLQIKIAPPELKFVRFDGVNFIHEALENLKNPNIDEAFLDTFILIDNNRNVVERFLGWKKD